VEWGNVNKKCGVLKAAPLSTNIRRMKEREERTTQVRHQYSVRAVYSSVLSIIIVVLCCGLLIGYFSKLKNDPTKCNSFILLRIEGSVPSIDYNINPNIDPNIQYSSNIIPRINY
jgi:hypothetical protein